MVSIQIRLQKDTATSMLERIAQALRLVPNNRLTLGAMANYAGFVEYGTRFMAAEPYLRPSIDAGMQSLVSAMAAGILDGQIQEVLESVGSEMEAMARTIVPVRTGYLQSTIYHQVT